METKYLYNITFRENDLRTTLEPRVPESAAPDEDRTIPRICLSPSIELCIQAIGPSDRDLHVNSKIIVRSVNVDNLDKCYLWTPDRLYQDKKVPDAIVTREYWYCASLSVTRSVYRVLSFDYMRVVNWPLLTTEQMLLVASKYVSSTKTLHTLTAERIYSEVTKELESLHKYAESDAFWEDIVALPWAQGLSITNLKLEEIA